MPARDYRRADTRSVDTAADRRHGGGRSRCAHNDTLGRGEAAEFDTRIPHDMANADKRQLELLVLFGLQSERVKLTRGQELTSRQGVSNTYRRQCRLRLDHQPDRPALATGKGNGFDKGRCCVVRLPASDWPWMLCRCSEAGGGFGECEADTGDEGLIGDDVVVAAAQVLHKRVRRRWCTPRRVA